MLHHMQTLRVAWGAGLQVTGVGEKHRCDGEHACVSMQTLAWRSVSILETQSACGPTAEVH